MQNKTLKALDFVARQARLNVIEQAVKNDTESFSDKIMLAPDLLNGVQSETVDYILATIFEAGLRDRLEIIRTSRKCSKRVQYKINVLFLTSL